MDSTAQRPVTRAHTTLDLAARQPRGRTAVADDVEGALVAAAQGDRSAFGTLYALHHRQILRFVRSRIPSSNDAEDVAQDVFLKALGAIGRYEARGAPFRSWLFAIAANAITDCHRAERRRRVAAEMSRTSLATHDPHEEILASVESGALWLAIRRLPTNQRTALILRAVEDLPLREIGVRMGRSEGAVKLLVHRARRCLRLQLADGDEAVVRKSITGRDRVFCRRRDDPSMLASGDTTPGARSPRCATIPGLCRTDRSGPRMSTFVGGDP